MVLVEVLKPLTTGGVTHARGAIVNATGWPKLPAMLRAGIVRYHVPLEQLAADLVKPTTTKPIEKGGRHGAAPTA